jgi:AraC-like DNA-binding protein
MVSRSSSAVAAMNAQGSRERLRFCKFPEIPEVEFLSGWFVREPFDAHMHETFTIGVVLAGSERFHCDGSAYLAPTGSIAVLNPGAIHKGGAGPEGWWSYRMIYPSQGVMDEIARELWGEAAGSPWFPDVLLSDEPLLALLAGLEEALEEADGALERQSLLFCALSGLLVRHARRTALPAAGGPERNSVLRTKRYLAEHLHTTVTLQDLSAVARLSPFYLLRVFHRTVGMPPHAYLRQLRVDRAKELLASGLGAAEVAAATGFADQSHLTRQFKRIVGITPGAYGRAISFKT